MKKNLDTIQFESRQELKEMMRAGDKLVMLSPEEKSNKTLERFLDLLESMDMEW